MSAQKTPPEGAKTQGTPPSADGGYEKQSFGAIFSGLWREQRQQGIFTHKGVIKQQKQLLGIDRSRDLLRSTVDAARSLHLHVPEASGEKLTFEQAMRKHRLTEAHLVAMSDRYKALQVAFYFFAIITLAYAWYLALGPTLLSAVPALSTAVALATFGYINAFRAWQIKHRSLISFEQALSIPSTYFVL